VEDDELTLQAAEEISRLYQIPDGKYRQRKMEDLGTNPAYRGGEPAVDQLNTVVSDLIEDYEKEREEAEEKLEEFEEFLDERKLELQHELNGVVEWLNGKDVDIDEIVDEEEVVEADTPCR